MTLLSKPCRPVSSAFMCGVPFAAAAATIVLTATVVLAQQGWEPMVSMGPATPPTAPRPQGKTMPKAKPTTMPFSAVEAAIESGGKAHERIIAAKVAASPATVTLETGSVKSPPSANDYCANIANPAADARFAWQKKLLADAEQEIAKRIALLEEKTAQYQKWLARRDEFSQKANETLLRIYTRMRPDAAAAQLAALDEETAAALLTKLDSRIASLILNEMDPAQAVRLTGTISGAGKIATAPPLKAVPEAKAK